MTDRQDEAAKEIAKAVQAIAPSVNVTAETVNAGLDRLDALVRAH